MAAVVARQRRERIAAGLQEPGKILPWVRVVEEELRRKEDVFKATAESCYNKH